MESLRPPRRPTVLIILDGFGVNPGKANNAVQQARTPRLDEYFAHHPHTVLEASGAAVGLPVGQMGNSEVGHITLGCGQVLRQDLVRIDDAIADQSFFQNPIFTYSVNKARDANRPLHLLGLVSDGGVHSHIRHILALIEICKQRGVRPLLHAITDGRDTAPRCAKRFFQELHEPLLKTGGAVATIMGRYYAMDRDKRWERSELAWKALVRNRGEFAHDPMEAIDQAYASGRGDEFVLPTVLPSAMPLIGDDSMIFFNFRNDRPRQLVQALALRDFKGFKRGDYQPLNLTTMTEFDQGYPCPVAFQPDRPHSTVSEIVSRAGLKQFHCAETEKYPHVTFFFNGGREMPFEGEERVMIPSPKVATYDLAPEMSAREVADAVVSALKKQNHAFVVVNFANGDMVGHTAKHDKIVEAVEVLDCETGRVLDAAVENGYAVLMTSDHGNCDETIDPVSGQPHSRHTLYPVPCLVIDEARWQLATGAGLSSIAPTLLQLMGIPKPDGMTAKSLLLEPAPNESGSA